MRGPASGKPMAAHATVVVIGEHGILIRGPSGSGKSRLALMLVAQAGRDGAFARLVSDDRVMLEPVNGRVVAHAIAAIDGLVEERGTGILRVAHEPAAVVRCIVDLVGRRPGSAPPRLPDPGEACARIGDVVLPRLAVHERTGVEESARRVLAFLERVTVNLDIV